MLSKIKSIPADREMKIRIKDLNTSSMTITDKGMELEFRDLDGKHVGDLMITPNRFIWNRGQTSKHGKSINWPELFKLIKTRE